MKSTNQIIQVIRGEAHWSSLQQLGFRILREADRWIMPPAPEEVAVPETSDLAAGILRFEFQADELREWASFVLAASSLINLERIDKTNVGQKLLEALWDLSFGKHATKEVIELARSAVQAEYRNKAP
jgi:hypothetical protein